MKLSSFHLALITGATSKLGSALCYALAKEKISLCLTSRNVSSLELLKKHLSEITFVQILPLDLAHHQDRLHLLTWIKEHHPDLVINNAGYGLYGDVLNFNIEEQINILDVNTKAPIEISITAAKTLINKQRQGCIMNISSAADCFAFPRFALYAASKGCLTKFSKAFDEEVSIYGVRILTSSPGQIATDFRLHASKGFLKDIPDHVMPIKYAVTKILSQIEKGKRYQVFSLKYRLMRLLALCLPEKLLMKFLKASLNSRIPSNKGIFE